MFRNTKKSEINHEHFGAGSVIQAGPTRNFLVIADHFNYVYAVDCNTFNIIGNGVVIEDKNWLTASEARELVNAVGSVLHMTFSDFTLYPAGMKNKLFGTQLND